MRNFPGIEISTFRKGTHRPRNVFCSDIAHDKLLRTVNVTFRKSGDIRSRSIVAVPFTRSGGEVYNQIVRRTVRRICGELHSDDRGIKFVGWPVRTGSPSEGSHASIHLVSDIACEGQKLFRPD